VESGKWKVESGKFILFLSAEICAPDVSGAGIKIQVTLKLMFKTGQY